MLYPRLVHDTLIASSNKFPNKDAIVFKSKRMTYSELNSESNKLAKTLISLGVNRHDRVIIFLDNSIESVISIYGILKTGAVFIPLNSLVKAPKLKYILKDSGAKVIITQSNKLDIVKTAVDRDSDLKVIAVGSKDDSEADNFSLLSWQNSLDEFNGEISGELEKRMPTVIDYDLAALIYTSGSSGEPKGVMSSHQNIISAASSIITYLENREEDIILNVLPLSFDYGLYQVIMSVMFSGTVVIEPAFLFPIKILEVIKKEKITGFPIVPTIVALLLSLQELEKHSLETVRYISNTGAALPIEHIKKFNAMYPNIQIYSMFGLTECKRIAYLPPKDILRKPGSVGKAMPHCEVFVVDENGNEVQPGVPGELIVRGANLMRGYWNAPELTSKVYREGKHHGEKLLYTGDVFKKDEEGYLYFLGRKDDMIKTKGERVSPKEIEDMLCSMEGIAEAAVIGVEDEILGKAIKAFLVKKNGLDITDRDILKHCKQNMEAFMVPKYVEFLDEFPRNSNGKVDKKKLIN